MSKEVDLRQIVERYKDRVSEVNRVLGIWEFHIDRCPVLLKIKVIKIEPRGVFMGIANYGIKGPEQAGPYWSIRAHDTVEGALEDALSGFLFYWKPEDADKTKFELDEDW